MFHDLLLSLIVILFFGFVGGQIAHKLGAPPLLGMMLAGICLGSQGVNFIAQEMLDLADDCRTIAVMVILMRAGLGLDSKKLIKQGSVALRLGFLPALTEAIAISWLAIWLFKFDWLTGLLLGCVISAESPAVIVPGMLRLKNLGWGVSKGIADAILTGSALSDVLILLLFSLLVNFLTPGNIDNSATSQIWFLPLEIGLQIILGVVIGYLAAKIIIFATVKRKWTQNKIQNTLITANLALMVVVLARIFPYFSGYLAVMAMGFFIIKFSPPVARQLRQEFNHLWTVAEILLFVLMGATIQLKILENVLLPGLLLLSLGLLLGRTIGWYLATLGSDWTWREKLFLLPGNSAKATVQAAIGAIPLSMGIPNGDIILAIAALSILVTAPLGAWAIPTFAPKLLSLDKVHPSQTAVVSKTVILGIVDNEAEKAIAVLTRVADLARRTNGEAVIVCLNHNQESNVASIESLIDKSLVDIFHQVIHPTQPLVEVILPIAQKYKATEIFLLQKQQQGLGETETPLDSIAQYILKNTDIPLTLVNALE